jgi:protein-S-isoprenylcysteine O-methyltransferase Ste14
VDGVIRALGWDVCAASRARVIGIICAISVLFTVGGYVPVALGATPWIVQAILWIPWLMWLGWFFPAHHGRAREWPPGRYRTGFFIHVAPGISWNFAQMTRPGLVGLAGLDHAPLRPVPVIVGLAVACGGGVMIAKALAVIGVDRALFLGEYEPNARAIVRSGIYGRLRHPLFSAGVVISVGMAMFFWQRDVLTMALVNVAVLPIYTVLEDHRCALAHERYDDYRRQVRAVVPYRWPEPRRTDDRVGDNPVSGGS